jgi:hypothetical protein
MTGSTVEQGSNSRQPAAGLVPETWPPANPIQPVKARRIPWWLAIPATIPAMLLPRRMGPHLAQSSWIAAYLVHVFCAVVAFGHSFAFVIERGSLAGGAGVALVANPLIELRRALAGTVLFFFGTLQGWIEVGIAVLIVAVIEVALWVGAVLLVPLYAAGEGPRRTYLRAVKLLLWSSACQVPVFWLFFRLMYRFEMQGQEIWNAALFVLLELWWLFVVVRLGGRYGGPKHGPRWQQRHPRCESCGYSLVSLPVNGRCPECGELVSASIPERRRPPAFARARGLPGRFVGFWQTTWAALHARRFARTVSVWSHHRAARNYALLVCVLTGLIAGAIPPAAKLLVEGRLASRVGWRLLPASEAIDAFLRAYEYIAVSIFVAAAAGCGTLAWMLLSGLFLSRFGFRDVADRVVARPGAAGHRRWAGRVRRCGILGPVRQRLYSRSRHDRV